MLILAAGGAVDNPSPLITSICNHEAAIRLGLTLTYDDLTQDEFDGLVMLHEARIEVAEKKLEMQKAADRAKRVARQLR